LIRIDSAPLCFALRRSVFKGRKAMISDIKPMRLVLAAMAGIVMAAFGAWLWMQVHAQSSRTLGFGALLVGVLVGLAIRAVAGRPDLRLAVLAGMLTLCGQVAGYYGIRWQMVDKMAKASGFGGAKTITIPLSSVPIMLWVTAIVSVWVACSIALRAGKRTLPSTA
jgi:hypothetical protein